MNTSEWIMLTQTIVFAATGFVVYWYTKETQKIRKETSNKNALLAEQLKVMKETILKEEKKEKSLLDPVLIFNGGGSSADGITIKMINKGAVIRNIKINNLAISHSYSPKDILESDKVIRFHFSKLPQDLPDEIKFIMEYEDKFGQRRTKEMALLTKSQKIIEKQNA